MLGKPVKINFPPASRPTTGGGIEDLSFFFLVTAKHWPFSEKSKGQGSLGHGFVMFILFINIQLEHNWNKVHFSNPL